MTVVSFVNMIPPQRFDAVPWSDAQIEESDARDGTWTIIDVVPLDLPLDPDPADPAPRSFTTLLGTGDDLWYRARFLDASLGFSEPSLPFLNSPLASASVPYATVSELARILKIRQPTAEQTASMLRVLETAATEIDAEIGRTAPFDDPPPALVVEVNLERAREHWEQQEAAFGIVGLGGNEVAMYVARDTWDRHAHKLAPLKETWGFA